MTFACAVRSSNAVVCTSSAPRLGRHFPEELPAQPEDTSVDPFCDAQRASTPDPATLQRASTAGPQTLLRVSTGFELTTGQAKTAKLARAELCIRKLATANLRFRFERASSTEVALPSPFGTAD